MVSENLQKQLKWFVLKLIEIRILKIDGQYAPIEFDPELITSCSTTDFNTSDKSPEQYINHMLNEIKGYLVSTRKISIEEFVWEKLKNNNIKINGCTTELLQVFLKEFLKEPISFFQSQNCQNPVDFGKTQSTVPQKRNGAKRSPQNFFADRRESEKSFSSEKSEVRIIILGSEL